MMAIGTMQVLITYEYRDVKEQVWSEIGLSKFVIDMQLFLLD